MTPEALQHDWLSLRYWLRRCVLPSAVVLLIVLAALKLISDTERQLDHMAVIALFFALYFILLRGGHILMTRSLHKDLETTYGQAYEQLLAQVNPTAMKRRSLSFTLARIKRQLIDDKLAKQQEFKR